jgi:hypothetical protein
MVEARKDSELNYAEIFSEYKRNSANKVMPKVAKVEDFLKNYKHRGQHYLGEVVKTGTGLKDWKIVVSDEFKPVYANGIDHSYNPLDSLDAL